MKSQNSGILGFLVYSYSATCNKCITFNNFSNLMFENIFFLFYTV